MQNYKAPLKLVVMEVSLMKEVHEPIRITYCSEWGYGAHAAILAAVIHQKFGLNVTLDEGHGGIFEVNLNNEVIYNNRNECGHLPTAEDIIGRISEIVTTTNKTRNDLSVL